MSDDERASVWLITRGSYSDYRVLAAAPTEADAQAIADKFNTRKGWSQMGVDIEEVDLFTADEVAVQVLVAVGVREDGTTWENLQTVWSWQQEPAFQAQDAGERRYQGAPQAFYRGTDVERVRKAAADRAAQIRAEREGL